MTHLFNETNKKMSHEHQYDPNQRKHNDQNTINIKKE